MSATDVRSMILRSVAAFLILTLAPDAFAASKYKVIYSFQGGTDGAYPISDLIADAEGNLYGTTSQGGTGCGSQGCGTVFELVKTKAGWDHKVLYSFAGYPNDGESPQSGLVFDTTGILFGTTGSGGARDEGTAFKLSPGKTGWSETVIYNFNQAGWLTKDADLTFDKEGNLYGTFSSGVSGGWSCNADGCGAVFKLSPQKDGSWSESTLYVFANAPDGAFPSSGVIFDSSGNLYGLTQQGGSGPCYVRVRAPVPGCGTLYQLTPSSGGNWTETILYNFTRGGGAGVYPSGGLFMDKAGHTYGATQLGGDSMGMVFKLENSQNKGWRQHQLHLFFGPPYDGGAPAGALVRSDTGEFFGATYYGGFHNNSNYPGGIVFGLRLTKHGWRERILHNFGAPGDGNNVQAGVTLNRSHIYGTTQWGGVGLCKTGCGTVYEIAP